MGSKLLNRVWRAVDQDGLAAYKAVELDDLLRGYVRRRPHFKYYASLRESMPMLTPARNAQAPVQHRECEGQESALFLSYFSDTGVRPGGRGVRVRLRVRYLQGGIESGFRKAETQEYKPRLLHVRKELKTLKSTEAGAMGCEVSL
jgi:advillin